MREDQGCCTWNQSSNGGTRRPTVEEFTYVAQLGYGSLAYKCAKCTEMQAMKLIRENVPGAGWIGNIRL